MTYQIVSERRKRNPGAIKKPSDAYELLKRYRNEPKEQFIAITLNASHEPISVSIVSIGLANQTTLSIPGRFSQGRYGIWLLRLSSAITTRPALFWHLKRIKKSLK